MTEDQRRAAIKEILDNKEPAMTGIVLTYNGERTPFNAYKIPLDILIYNPYNGRIGSEVKSYERQHHKLNPENSDDVKIIEEFLWKSKVSANEATMKSLLKEHQKQFGIVTADGVIIDGNRRASLLNRIWRDQHIDANDKQHCRFFLAVVLPQDADKKEILRLETTYQMGEEAKLDYNPIEKYLKCGDLIEEGFTEAEIASFMAIKRSNVVTYLRVLKLMDEYLESYGYDGMYTQIGAREDVFLKLEPPLRDYQSGNNARMWDYDLEGDVSDLKTITFDYIRLGFDSTDFRNLIRKPTAQNPAASFFACKDIWNGFVERHFEIIDSIEEDSVESIIESSPDADLTRLLRARDNSWIEKVESRMERNYKVSLDSLENLQDAHEPRILLDKAISALSSVDMEQETFMNDPNIKCQINKIEEIVDSFKRKLGI